MPPTLAFVPGRVSVILITYNYARFIGPAIDSVLSQRIADLEIIVVDDGSTDPTPEALAPYGDRIIYRRQENAGQSAARNAGLALATGEFIQFLDSDDLLGPRKIAVQMAWLCRHRSTGIVVSPAKLFSRIDGKGDPVVTGGWHLFGDHLDVHLCMTNIAPPHAFLFRREVLSGDTPFDSAVDNCEDYDLLLRASVRGHVPAHVPGCAVYYRKHGQSVTARAQRQYRTDAAMCRRLAALLDDHPTFPENRRIEGLMAFAAGTLQTAARLARTQPETADGLVALACQYIAEAALRSLGRRRAAGYPLILYCIKTAMALTNPRIGTARDLAAARQEFDRLLARIGRFAMIAAAIKGFFGALVMPNPVALREHLYLTLLLARRRTMGWNGSEN